MKVLQKSPSLVLNNDGLRPLLLDRSCLAKKIQNLTPLINKLDWINDNDALFRAYWNYFASDCKDRLLKIRHQIEQNTDFMHQIKDKKAALFLSRLTRNKQRAPNVIPESNVSHESAANAIYEEFVDCFRRQLVSNTVKRRKRGRPQPQSVVWKREIDSTLNALKTAVNPYEIEQINEKLSRLKELEVQHQPSPFFHRILKTKDYKDLSKKVPSAQPAEDTKRIPKPNAEKIRIIFPKTFMQSGKKSKKRDKMVSELHKHGEVYSNRSTTSIDVGSKHHHKHIGTNKYVVRQHEKITNKLVTEKNIESAFIKKKSKDLGQATKKEERPTKLLKKAKKNYFHHKKDPIIYQKQQPKSKDTQNNTVRGSINLPKRIIDQKKRFIQEQNLSSIESLSPLSFYERSKNYSKKANQNMLKKIEKDKNQRKIAHKFKNVFHSKSKRVKAFQRDSRNRKQQPMPKTHSFRVGKHVITPQRKSYSHFEKPRASMESWKKRISAVDFHKFKPRASTESWKKRFFAVDFHKLTPLQPYSDKLQDQNQNSKLKSSKKRDKGTKNALPIAPLPKKTQVSKKNVNLNDLYAMHRGVVYNNPYVRKKQSQVSFKPVRISETKPQNQVEKPVSPMTISTHREFQITRTQKKSTTDLRTFRYTTSSLNNSIPLDLMDKDEEIEEQPVLLEDLVMELMKSRGMYKFFNHLFPEHAKKTTEQSPQLDNQIAKKPKFKRKLQTKIVESEVDTTICKPCKICDQLNQCSASRKPLYMEQMQRQNKMLELRSYYNQMMLLEQEHQNLQHQAKEFSICPP